MSNQNRISNNNRRLGFNTDVDGNVATLFGPNEDEGSIPRSPFVLHGLAPEIEQGNIEYKLKIVDPSPERLEHLITQMHWRLQEGQGEAFYEIGIEDCGTFKGITTEELEASIATLKKMAKRLGASATIVCKQTLDNGRHIVEVLVRKVPDDQYYIDLRVAVLGTVNSGKSSLVGVCTHGELDNGQGRARLNLFRHLHEIQSGRTSSITYEILGFNDAGQSINYENCRTANEICNRSTKIITFIDLAGHKKYMKTTVFGLAALHPDFAMLCIDAPTGVVDTTREHLSLAIALGLPVFVVINKIDVCSQAAIQQTIECLTSLLKRGDSSIQFKPYFIQNEADLTKAADLFVQKSICPILSVSCVTGQNIDLLKQFFNILPSRLSGSEQEILSQLLVEFRIDHIYTNNASDEVVVGGILRSGTIHEGDSYLLGPLNDGSFVPAKIATIQRYRVPRRIVNAGQAASLSLLKIKSNRLRKGMVLVSPAVNPQACYEFVAEISLTMHHTNTPIHKGFETTVQIENIRQTALVVDMDTDELYANQKTTVTFRFKTRCEYVLEDARLIFRSGQQTKGSGRVIKVLPQNEPNTRT